MNRHKLGHPNNSVLKNRLTANNAAKSLSAVPEIVDVLDMEISDFGSKVLDILFFQQCSAHLIVYVL